MDVDRIITAYNQRDDVVFDALIRNAVVTEQCLRLSLETVLERLLPIVEKVPPDSDAGRTTTFRRIRDAVRAAKQAFGK